MLTAQFAICLDSSSSCELKKKKGEKKKMLAKPLNVHKLRDGFCESFTPRNQPEAEEMSG